MKCLTCQGKRIITKMQPNMQGPSGNRYQSSVKPYAPRNYICEACKGTGKARPHLADIPLVARFRGQEAA